MGMGFINLNIKDEGPMLSKTQTSAPLYIKPNVTATPGQPKFVPGVLNFNNGTQ
jgi:hypothetical protein